MGSPSRAWFQPTLLVEGLVGPVLSLPQLAEIEVGVGPADCVAGLGVQVQGTAEVGVGRAKVAQPGADRGEKTVGFRGGGGVGKAVTGGHRSLPGVG
jgi:hypothetical protein